MKRYTNKQRALVRDTWRRMGELNGCTTGYSFNNDGTVSLWVCFEGHARMTVVMRRSLNYVLNYLRHCFNGQLVGEK